MLKPRTFSQKFAPVLLGLALVSLWIPASASATVMAVPSSQFNPSPICIGNGWNLQGNFVYIDRDPSLRASLQLVDGRPSQFSIIEFQEPVVRWGNGVRAREQRVELIAEGTNQVLHQARSSFTFILANGQNGGSGAVNSPDTYMGRNLVTRVIYDLADDSYGRCTLTLVSNRLGPVSTNTQYTPAAPEFALPAGQANPTPGTRAQVNLTLNNPLGSVGTPEPLSRWTVDYGYADSEGANFDSCRGAEGGPPVSVRLDAAAPARGEYQPRASTTIDIPANKAGKWICVRQRIQSTLGGATSPVTYKWITGSSAAPSVPTIAMRNLGAQFEVGQEFLLTLDTSGSLAPGERLLDRLVYHNWVAGPDASCDIGLDRPIQYQDLGRQTQLFLVPSIMVGKWFCAKQIIQTNSGVKASPVVYRQVLANARDAGLIVPLAPPRPALPAELVGAGIQGGGGQNAPAGNQNAPAAGGGGGSAARSDTPATVDIPPALVAAGVDGRITPLIGTDGEGTYQGLTLKVKVPTVQKRGVKVRATATVTPRTKGKVWFTFTRTGPKGKVAVSGTRKATVRGTQAKTSWTLATSKPTGTYLLIVRFVPSKRGAVGGMVVKPILLK